MIKPRYKVELYKKDIEDDNRWSEDYIDVSDLISIDDSTGIEARKDTFSFKVLNKKNKINGEYDSKIGLKELQRNRFGMRDNIKLYLWNGDKPTTFSDALVMDGLITDLSQSTSETNKLISVKGANRSEVMLSNMVPTAEVSNPVPNIIKNIIARINQFDSGKFLVAALDNEPMYGTYNGKTYNLGSGLIQSKHSDGVNFVAVPYSQNWKNSYEQIEELSGPSYTDPVGSYPEEGKFLFDIVNTKVVTPEGESISFNTVRWRNKSVNVLGSIIEGSVGSTGFKSGDFEYGTYNVVNAVIVAGGNNLVGGGILQTAYNQSSMGKLGAKWKFVPLVKTFDTIYNKEKVYITDTNGDRFPDAYPYTTHTLYNNVACSNNKDFNDALVVETGSQILKAGQQIVDLLGEARYKAKIELLYGTNAYNNGELYYLEVPSFGWENTVSNPSKVLRMVNSSHVYDKDGWKTVLDYEEDEKVVSEQVND